MSINSQNEEKLMVVSPFRIQYNTYRTKNQHFIY